jgi:plasmid stabilization system protein ParE
MEVVFSQQAELDLEEIADTIAIDSSPAAIRFI